MKPAPSEIRTCRHCHAPLLLARLVLAPGRWRSITIYADADPLLGTLACYRNRHRVWEARALEPGERPRRDESMHMEHPTSCPKKPPTGAAGRPQERAARPLPEGVISLDQARLKRAQRRTQGR
ncbi:hypothetical protein [Nonomuraea sp. NPDC023979]|uniref:hypothetical protein n=1 Tax=Nonomuraea sp. NPDC023979 TaxID=3154796 RepID=UPI0033DF82F8